MVVNMRIITIVISFLSFAIFAEDLKIVDVQLGCIDKKQDTVNDPFKYRYGVELRVQNQGKNSVTLLTKINSLVSIPTANTDELKTHRVLSYNPTKRGDTNIIPAKHKLDLVELYPGDQTIISYQFSDKNLLKHASFEYYSKNIYGGRFNHWVGRLNTKEVTTQIMYKCKT